MNTCESGLRWKCIRHKIITFFEITSNGWSFGYEGFPEKYLCLCTKWCTDSSTTKNSLTKWVKKTQAVCACSSFPILQPTIHSCHMHACMCVKIYLRKGKIIGSRTILVRFHCGCSMDFIMRSLWIKSFIASRFLSHWIFKILLQQKKNHLSGWNDKHTLYSLRLHSGAWTCGACNFAFQNLYISNFMLIHREDILVQMRFTYFPKFCRDQHCLLSTNQCYMIRCSSQFCPSFFRFCFQSNSLKILCAKFFDFKNTMVIRTHKQSQHSINLQHLFHLISITIKLYFSVPQNKWSV